MTNYNYPTLFENTSIYSFSTMVQAIQFRGSAEGKVVQTRANLPPIKYDEVLVRVTHSGLCGSDIHMIPMPLVLGHEGIVGQPPSHSFSVQRWPDPCFPGVGILEQVGSCCSQFNVGDRVGWGPIGSTCGHCEQCMTGKDAYCPEARSYGVVDFDTMGSICSHAIRKEQWIFHIPESMSSENAAPLMCKSPFLIRNRVSTSQLTASSSRLLPSSTSGFSILSWPRMPRFFPCPWTSAS